MPVKRKKPLPPVLKDVVKQLNDCKPFPSLWYILTALRGPDDGSIDKKRATTAVIRWKLGLKPGLGYVVAEDTAENVSSRIRMFAKETDRHFITHASEAFSALGLKWDKLNK